MAANTNKEPKQSDDDAKVQAADPAVPNPEPSDDGAAKAQATVDKAGDDAVAIVQAAQAEAKRIVDQAHKDADDIVKDATAVAESIVDTAKAAAADSVAPSYGSDRITIAPDGAISERFD